MESANQDEIVQLTADIVSAYVANNKIGTNELSKLFEEPIRKSVTPDYIVSLEDGRKFKSLKRHLQGSYGMTPDEYRSKWGLPRDYPMVAPNYAKARSDLAKRMGLGRKAGATPVKKGASGRGRKRAAR
jgi:predicted transcriptional regulator